MTEQIQINFLSVRYSIHSPAAQAMVMFRYPQRCHC